MKKSSLVFSVVLFVFASFTIYLLFELKIKNRTIVELNAKMKADSLLYESRLLNENNAFEFMQIAVTAFPENRTVKKDDSLKAQVFLSGYNMVTSGVYKCKPFIIIGSEVDTANLEMIGHCDTIKQQVWNPKFAVNTSKIGLNTIAGLYCIRDSSSGKIIRFPFWIKYNVIDSQPLSISAQ